MVGVIVVAMGGTTTTKWIQVPGAIREVRIGEKIAGTGGLERNSEA